MTPLQRLITKKDPLSLRNAVRMVGAVLLSLCVAQLIGLPESYWAGITTMAVLQSTRAAGLEVGVQYFAGTAVGAAIGGWAGQRFSGNAFVFGACALLIGLLFARFRLERSAYRTAVITLAIVILVRTHTGWTAAVHRFLEVSVGVSVGLAVTALWPERAAG